MTRIFITSKSNAPHIANEWADAAANGVQYLRNLRDGIGDVGEALTAMELNVARINELPDTVEYQPTIEQAMADYRAATNALEDAELVLDKLLGENTPHPGRTYNFVRYDPHRNGSLTLEWHSYEYGSESVTLTPEDLQAPDPGTAYKARLAAEEEAKRQRTYVQTVKNRTDALVAQLAAMTPEARAELLAKAEGKS